MNKSIIQASREYADDIHGESDRIEGLNKKIDSILDFEAGVAWLLKVQEEESYTTGFYD